MSVQALWISDHFALPIARHSHNYYQLIYCLHGNGEIEIGESVYTATPGKAYLIKPCEMHAISTTKDMRIAEIKFEIDDEKFENTMDMLPEEVDIDEHVSRKGEDVFIR